MAQRSPKDPHHSPLARDSPAAAELSSRRTVLIVDDQPIILKWMGRSLHDSGYDVLLAPDVPTALSLLQSSTIDALILDLRLVGRSGLDVLEYVRGHKTLASMPVIVLTGIVQLTADEEDTIRRNKAYVFYKPEGVHDIVATLDRLLNRGNTRP